MEPNNNWSTRLFLKINKSTGTNKTLDRLMVFFADDLVYFLVLISLLWATTGLEAQDPALLGVYLKLMITAFGFGIGLSWLIGYIIPCPRPIRTMPFIHQLIKPLGTWKSFPSDHTIGSFIVASITLIMGAPVALVGLLYLIAACIAIGRVYVGVHYPRDILGGLLIALVFSFAAPTLLEIITEPVYDVIKLLFI